MIRFMRCAVIATAAFTLGALAQEKPTDKKAAKKATESAVEKKVDAVETKKSAAKKKADTAVEAKKTETEKKAPIAAAKATEKKAVAKAGAPYTGGIVNLNTATKSQLESLPGVGEANANHIIKGRPYKSADELLTRKIIQERYFNEFKAYVTTK